MLKKIKQNSKNKKALSLMVSYVLLVSIVIIVSISVIAWLMTYADITPVVDCEPATSVLLDSYECFTSGNIAIKLSLRNNGHFNVRGAIIAVGDDSNSTPSTYLIPENLDYSGVIPGEFFFLDGELKPQETEVISFLRKSKDPYTQIETNLDFNIEHIQIQPFIYDSKTGVVVCSGTIIKEILPDCQTI